MRKKASRTFWDRAQEALREARAPSTQAEVARMLGISQPAVSEWNKPGGYPTMENVITIAERANVCVEWLYTERGPKRPIPQDKAAQRLWDSWNHLDDVTKGELIGIAASRAKEMERSHGSQDSATELQRSSSRGNAA